MLKPSREFNFQLITENFPKNFDMAANFYAYVYSQVNREDQLVELQNRVNQYIGKNLYAKEVADQMLSFGHQGYKNMVNYFNVQKAGNIDGNTLLKEHLAKT